MADANSLKLPVLILVRGVPGSGKSYFSDRLGAELTDTPHIVLDPDATDYTSQEYRDHVAQQIQDGVDKALHPYRFLRAKAYDAINKHQVIIWNQPFTDLEILKKVTDRLQEQAVEYGTTLPVLLVEVEIPDDVAKERVAKRKSQGGHGPSDERFAKFVAEYSSAKANGYQTITIDGLTDPENYIPEVIQTLQQLRG